MEELAATLLATGRWRDCVCVGLVGPFAIDPNLSTGLEGRIDGYQSQAS
jgi:hypothetical protein